jgi:hypothetical protein
MGVYISLNGDVYKDSIVHSSTVSEYIFFPINNLLRLMPVFHPLIWLGLAKNFAAENLNSAYFPAISKRPK